MQAGAISPAEIAALVAPVALYPDELLAVVLRATTQPVQVVQAARFLDKYAKDKSLKPNPSWTEPVRILVNYPDVVRKLNDDLDWVERLGEAVQTQQGDVLAAVQQFRRKAAAAGNLRSDDKQVVAPDGASIVIESANPQVIYVPVYDPVAVLVQQPAPPPPVYEPTAYPAYYAPAATAATGFFAGALTTAWVMNWNNWNIDEDNISHYQQSRQQSQSQRQQSRQDTAAQRQQTRQDSTAQRQQGRQDARQPAPAPTGGQQDLRAALGGERPAQRPAQGGNFQQQRPAAAERPAQRPAQGGNFQQQRPAGGERPGYQPQGGGGLQARQGGGDAFNYGSGRGAFQASDRGAQSRNMGGGGREFSGGGRGGGRRR